MDALNRMEEMRFVGMEFFGNRPHDTHDASIDQVDLCEVFVGVIGFRYGSGITEAEYRRARKLGLPCFMYFKRGEATGPEQTDQDPALAAKLATFKAELLTGHTVKEFDRPEELAANATADLHNWVAARWIAMGGDAEAASRPAKPSTSGNRNNQLRLIERIQHDWVDGVLHSSLHRQARLELALDWQDDAVDQPWDRILVAPDRPVQTLGRGETIASVYAGAQNTLLILGEPGAGKTTTLLELVRSLVSRARESADQPAPVVLALSTWTVRHVKLEDWVVEELNVRYQVPKRLGREWLQDGSLALLLDGLDEVRESIRPVCVAAINTFTQEQMPAGLVVTCRVAEYAALSERLRLRSAICLQPLTSAQIDAYFASAGTSLESLRAAMREDEALQKFAQTPLMLSVMTMAWRGVSEGAWQAGAGVSIEQRRRQLFDAYVETALRRKGAKAGSEFASQTKTVLPWLARQMKSRDQTLFALEQLQPDWLGQQSQRTAYFFLTRILSALCVAVPLQFFPLTGAGRAGLLGAAIVSGVILACWDHFIFGRPDSARVITPRDRALGCAVLTGLLPLGVLPLLHAAGVAMPSDFTGIWGAYAVTVAVTLSAPVDVKRQDIRPADAIAWSWPQALRRAGMAVIVWQWFLLLGAGELLAIGGMRAATKEFGVGLPGFWPGFGIGLTAAVVWIFATKQRGWLGPAVAGALAALGAEIGLFVVNGRGSLFPLMVTLLLGLLIGLFGGLTSGIDANRARRSGAWFWVKVPALAALIVGLTVALAIAGVGSIAGSDNMLTAVAIGSVVGGILALVAFVRFGGLQGLQHFVLRRQLVRSGVLPQDVTSFLDEAVRVHLLQKVGFGYRFIHALLLDHFASAGESPDTNRTP
jgi:DNA polymerase III delta prime subunit